MTFTPHPYQQEAMAHLYKVRRSALASLRTYRYGRGNTLRSEYGCEETTTPRKLVAGFV